MTNDWYVGCLLLNSDRSYWSCIWHLWIRNGKGVVEVIIGLSGYAQSGKDTVANILVQHYGYKRVAFADKIRECLFALCLLYTSDAADE